MGAQAKEAIQTHKARYGIALAPSCPCLLCIAFSQTVNALAVSRVKK
jgi:hypothetical protein